MSAPLSNEDILVRIEQAFAPHSCTASYADEGQRFDFEVVNEHGDVVAGMNGVIFARVREPASLDIVINYMREKIQEAERRQI